MTKTKEELRDFKVINAAIFVGDPVVRHEVGDVVSLNKKDAEHFMGCNALQIDTTSLYEPVPETDDEQSDQTEPANDSGEAGEPSAPDAERGKPSRRRRGQ